MGDDFQQKAVDRILARLSPWQDNDLDAILDPYWIISSCQISFIEGDQLEGGDGTVSAGRWNRTKVAVKKLQKGTSREVCALSGLKEHLQRLTRSILATS